MLFKYQNLFKPFLFSKVLKCSIYECRWLPASSKKKKWSWEYEIYILLKYLLCTYYASHSTSTPHEKCKQNSYIKHLNSLENRKGLNKFWCLNNIVLASLKSLMN